MKNLRALICFILLAVFAKALPAQEANNDYLTRSLIYDYTEATISNTDTIPDFNDKTDKLMLTGTIYESDGVTPAKDVLLYIYQADENGDYNVQMNNGKKSVRHQGWIKTDENGQYTFYTFVPGSAVETITFPRRLAPKEIVPIIKEQGKSEYELNAFMFDDDPQLSKRCRKRLQKKGMGDTILKLEKKDDIYVATKNIVLKSDDASTR